MRLILFYLLLFLFVSCNQPKTKEKLLTTRDWYLANDINVDSSFKFYKKGYKRIRFNKDGTCMIWQNEKFLDTGKWDFVTENNKSLSIEVENTLRSYLISNLNDCELVITNFQDGKFGTVHKYLTIDSKEWMSEEKINAMNNIN